MSDGITLDMEDKMGKLTDNFDSYRKRMNEVILEADDKVIKRFYSLDTLAYRSGTLDTRTKEMLGLVASMVLRCDDCVKYHIIQCHESGLTRDEFFEVFGIALVVGGSIVIPHLRRAVEFLEDLQS